MLSIAQAQMPGCESDVRALFAEYLSWGNSMLSREYGITMPIEAMLESDMAEIGKFLPPNGCLLLAAVDGMVAGCACMRRIGPDVGELKRMYVRPAYRGQGIGRSLLVAVLEQAHNARYSRVRLDSARFMKEAHTLYASAGFREIGAYPESEIPEQFRHHWVFMEYAPVR